MKAFRHVGITVTDLEKMLYFYQRIMGFKIKREMDEAGSFIENLSGLRNVKVKTVKMSADDGSLIELLYYESHSRTAKNKDICDIGYSHIAFTVDNLDSEYEKLNKEEIKFNYKPQISPDGKAKVAFCRDPEGNLIELVEEIG